MLSWRQVAGAKHALTQHLHSLVERGGAEGASHPRDMCSEAHVHASTRSSTNTNTHATPVHGHVSAERCALPVALLAHDIDHVITPGHTTL